MGKEKIVVQYRGKNIVVDAHRCSFVRKGIGLMFSRRESAQVLLFEFGKPSSVGIHSYFVFFDFLAVWVGEVGDVIQVDRVKPWVSYLRPREKYVKLIEIPINKSNEALVKKFLK